MRKLQLYFYGTMAIIMFTASCVGCANISYLSPSGESFSYNRLGTQKISGLRINKDKDGLVRFEVDTQEGTEGKILSDITYLIKEVIPLKATLATVVKDIAAFKTPLSTQSCNFLSFKGDKVP